MAVTTQPDADLNVLLDAALAASGFWNSLGAVRATSKRPKRKLRIAIKPDLDAFENDSATATNPALIEQLILRLRESGYECVTLCDGRNESDGWLHNRSAACVPDLIGYRFEAPAGSPYQVRFTDDDAVRVALGQYDTQTDFRVSTEWMHADFRIVFAKNKAHDRFGYALCLYNLLGLISSESRARDWAPEEQCLLVLRHARPHFAIVDALTVAHDAEFASATKALQTNGLVASSDVLLADWIAALKMGTDPYLSPINSLAVNRMGLPTRWTIDGNADAWPEWTSTDESSVRARRSRARWPELDSFLRAVLQEVDRERFPFRDIAIDQLNLAVRARVNDIADVTALRAIGSLLQQLISWLALSHAAYSSVFNKHGLLRSDAPVLADLDQLSFKEIDGTRAVVEQAERALAGTKPDARGFHFRTLDGHIHFGGSTTIQLPFDEFVERVDVSHAIQYMNDYLGGCWIPVTRDANGRPTRQVERNVYVPQPNWTALFGGDVIDVEKFEVIKRTPSRHCIWWRTIHSQNKSSDADDGAVRFVKDIDGHVQVHIFARQRFRQPYLVAAAHVERFPRIYAELVSDAYGQFFDVTIANLKRAYDGEDYRIGREPSAIRSEVRSIISTLGAAAALLARFIDGASMRAAAPAAAGGLVAAPIELDSAGFAHYAGNHFSRFVVAQSAEPWSRMLTEQGLTTSKFLLELGQAIARDARGLAGA